MTTRRGGKERRKENERRRDVPRRFFFFAFFRAWRGASRRESRHIMKKAEKTAAADAAEAPFRGGLAGLLRKSVASAAGKRA